MLRKLILIIALLAVPSILFATRSIVSVQGIVHSTTQTVVSTDTAANLPADVITTTGVRASAVYITCEDANIRWTVGGGDDPDTATPLGHILYSAQGLRIANSHWIKTFRFISAEAQTPARLQITSEHDTLK